MQPIVEIAQPYVTTVVTALVGALVAVLLSAVGVVKAKAVTYLDSKLDAKQRELLHRVAGEAYAYAATVFKSEESQIKLAQALEYATQQLGRKGINVTPMEIRAAIEAAYLNGQTSVTQ
ncbi:phage holin, LLH family [Paenibacillus sp. FSL R10-2771]|uniref:phage holin, LLH family n=1 Tax=Paenibacillus sp. FSL R10-2771 TaxID=2954693 RepID=UPI0030FB2E19